MINQLPVCPGGTLYQIRPGDSFYTLALRFDVTVEALVQANPNVNPQNLQLGQTICIPVAPQNGSCPGGFLYTIQAGDTYFSLARSFGIAVQALAAANPGVDPSRLQIGQRICIPTTPPQRECPGMTYTIRPGDTFFSIANQFGTTVQLLIQVNPGVNPEALRIGQIICLPAGTSAPIPCPGGTIYRVRAGDTFYAISVRYGISLSRLAEANPQITDPAQLQIGEAICIPAAV